MTESHTLTETDIKERDHVLIVDDDDRIRNLLKRFLQKKQFRVTIAHNAETARKLIRNFIFDIMVFDIMMPGEDGLSLLNWKNKHSDIPVLMLTALGDASNRIAGLETGADDYLVKPFEPEELFLRLLAILKRSRSIEEASFCVLFGSCIFHPKTHELYCRNKLVKLTSGEADLMTVFAQNLGQTINRYDLLQEKATNRSLDIQITRLRKKIEENPKAPRWLQTVRGKGYRLLGKHSHIQKSAF